jgi:uncharacterized membrane protein
MKKRRSLRILAAFVILLTGSVLFHGQRARAAEYDIQQYFVMMSVSEDNVYSVTEIISVYFYTDKHGIYRKIPLKNQIQRADGSTDTVRARISDVSCGTDSFSVSHDAGNYTIQIGDADTTVTGEKTYTISYQYHMGNDVLKDADEFYYNLIGSEWDTTIENVSFSIRMPKEFDETKLGFSYGTQGSQESEKVTYQTRDSQIIGSLDSKVVLYPGQALTVRLELPDGYFTKSREISWYAIGSILSGVITMLLAFFLWSMYGKDDPVVETVEFYPPDGLNSVEASYLYKGYLPKNDVVSLIVDLAQKGYIEIRDSVMSSKLHKDFVLIKQKEYAGTKFSEFLFMEGLFQKGNFVSRKDLQDSFYKTIEKIQEDIKKEYKKQIFDPASLNKNWILYVLLVVVFLAAGYAPIYNYVYVNVDALVLALASGVIVTAFSQCLFSSGSIAGKLLAAAVLLFFFVGSILPAVLPALLAATALEQAAFLVAVVTGLVVGFFAAYMPKRTPYGTRMLGKIGGFRNFLETAEKSRLETMVSENPQYFYDILPYAYALGVSKVWMEKFESIATEPPTWYGGHHGTFNVIQFNTFMNSTMTAAASSMTSSPSSNHSGGGISGGGSGGGGGGSW